MSLNHYGVEGSGTPVVFFATALPSNIFSLKGESLVFKQAPKEEKGGGTGEGD